MKRDHRIGNGKTLCLGLMLTSTLSVALLAGCGGGGTSRVVSKTPTKATKDHVKLVQNITLRALAQSGVPNGAFNVMRGGIVPAVGVGTVGSTTIGAGDAVGTAGGASSAPAPPPVPLLGQFLSNVAFTSVTNRTKAIHAMQAHHNLLQGGITRDTSGGSSSSSGSSPGSTGSGPNIPVDPPVPIIDPLPTFYYDDYLGLWVSISDTATSSTYLLYEDQAKTKPAGSIVTTFPADNVYPQVYASTYTFTAGNQAGSNGNYKNTLNQDGSGSSSYLDVYADGAKDQGSSSWTARGDYSWTGRTDNADKTYSSMRGTFHADGSGAMHSDGSDGYVSDFTYNSNGSGHGRVTGPDPGLPATIVWDTQGNITITYADGTSDFIRGWGYGPVEPDGGIGTGVVGTGVVGSTTVTSPPTPPTAPASKAVR